MEKDFIKIQKESTRIAKKPTVNRSARLNVKNQIKYAMVSNSILLGYLRKKLIAEIRRHYSFCRWPGCCRPWTRFLDKATVIIDGLFKPFEESDHQAIN